MSTIRGIETVLLGELLRPHGERFGVAAFACVKDRQRLARLGGRRRLGLRATGLRRLEAGEEAGEPGTLLRRRARDDAVERINVFRRERCVLRKQRLGGHKRLLDISRPPRCAKTTTFGARVILVAALPQRRLAGFDDSPARAPELRLVYLDLVRPRQPGARPIEADENDGRAMDAQLRRWRRRPMPAPSPAHARSTACRSRR